jgi:hypothetical protein
MFRATAFKEPDHALCSWLETQAICYQRLIIRRDGAAASMLLCLKLLPRAGILPFRRQSLLGGRALLCRRLSRSILSIILLSRYDRVF